MRIHYCSDIHLEFGDAERPLPSGDVMVLAGDITLIGALDPADDMYFRHAELRHRTMKFFDDIRQNFDRVFYLIGNHEAYSYSLTAAPKVIRKFLPHVELLNDTVVDLADDTILVGGTLWTDMNGNSQGAHDVVGRSMNDFRLIHTGKDNVIFTTRAAVKRHRKTLACIKGAALGHPDKTIIVATHHAPSYKGINSEHSGSTFNAGYASSLEDFICEHKNIRHWIFGHTHIQTSFDIGQCKVVSNSRGYVGREASARTFEMDRSFEVLSCNSAREKFVA